MASATDFESRVAAAVALIDSGDALQAIDELTALYHEHPDHEIARRLVEARHTAFTELSPTQGRARWPDRFDDPFPGQDGLVEATRAELSGEFLGGAITHHGCVRIKSLLDDETVDRLRSGIERAFRAREQAKLGQPTEEAAPWFDPFAPGRKKAEGFGAERFVRVVDVPEAACDLVDVFGATGVTAAVTSYFGERPVMIANKWILRRSESGVRYPDFHQDGAFLGEGIRTVDCWIALSDCGPGTDRPAIDLVPCRVDRVLESDSRSTLSWSLAEPRVTEALPDVPVASPVFAPGDAMFFDELLVHRTSVGSDLKTRYAIESWFVAPSSYPDIHLPIVL